MGDQLGVTIPSKTDDVIYEQPLIIADLCPGGCRCVAHEAAPEARGGDRVQVQRERAEAAGEDCPSS